MARVKYEILVDGGRKGRAVQPLRPNQINFILF
jgi:hypothetical protein